MILDGQGDIFRKRVFTQFVEGCGQRFIEGVRHPLGWEYVVLGVREIVLGKDSNDTCIQRVRQIDHLHHLITTIAGHITFETNHCAATEGRHMDPSLHREIFYGGNILCRGEYGDLVVRLFLQPTAVDLHGSRAYLFTGCEEFTQPVFAKTVRCIS